MKLAILLSVILLTGCAEWQAIKSGIGSYGAEASDEVLDSAIWTICNASPVGAHKRRFKTGEEIAALKVLCGEP
jgi:hypothetical protein